MQPVDGSKHLPATRPLLPSLQLHSLLRCLLLCGFAVLTLAARAQTVPAAIEGALPPEFTLSQEPPQEIVEDLPNFPPIDLTTEPEDLWQRVRNGFAMPNLDSPLVVEREAWYLNRPEMLKRLLASSHRYIYYIVQELEKRGMPTELALLPLVESAYNPMAYSRARASGLWQFIPSTGKSYRLEQTWWLDQRRDIVASTGAALDYLQTIYEMHGDWQLALASYNWGEHAVARAIAKNQAKGLPTDYISLTMPGETRYYVPKLQAIKNIVANPKLFGLNIDALPNKPYFDAVGRPADMDVTLAAKLAETPLAEFKALNPSYNRPVMLAKKGSPLLLPADKVQIFLANLESYEQQEKPLSNWTTYKMKKGEKLASVAARVHMTLIDLRQINGITNRTKIGTGTTLLVPGKGANLQAVNLPLTPRDLPKQKAVKGKKGKKVAAKTKVAKKPVKGKKKVTIPAGKKHQD